MNNLFTNIGAFVFGWMAVIGAIPLAYTLTALILGWSFGLSLSIPLSLLCIVGIIGMYIVGKANGE